MTVSRSVQSVRTMTDPRFAAFRAVTTYVRPPHSHGCPPVEVVPGVWVRWHLERMYCGCHATTHTIVHAQYMHHVRTTAQYDGKRVVLPLDTLDTLGVTVGVRVTADRPLPRH